MNYGQLIFTMRKKITFRMQDKNQETEQRLTLSTINTMVRVLNEALRNNPNLATDLLFFLKEKKDENQL